MYFYRLRFSREARGIIILFIQSTVATKKIMAKEQIDVYRDWLEITETARPLNYYQLLKLPQFEDDRNKIRKQYRQLNAHVRRYASGDYIEESQELLNELAKAMLCLTDASRKEEYDTSLGRTTKSTKRRQTLGDLLVNNKIITAEQFKKAQSYADSVGLELPQSIIQHKFAEPEVVMLGYAESIGLPFINLEDVGVDEEYSPMINPNTARQNSFVPVMVDQGNLIVASPTPVNPDVEEELRLLFDMPVRSAICIPAQINTAIAKYYPRDAVQMVVKKTGKPTETPAKKEKTKKAKPSKPEPEDDEYNEVNLDAEQKKQRILATIVAFNLCLILIVGLLPNFFPKMTVFKFPYSIGTALVVGGIAAAITWMVKSKE